MAVDEAHRVAEWYVIFFKIYYYIKVRLYRGPQFRKAFHNLGGLRSLSSTPMMALTASAPMADEVHVVSFLSMRTPLYVRNPLDRGNIYYSVMKKSSVSVT